jgi:hypothetical protein
VSSAWSCAVPLGLVVHPSMAVPTHPMGTSSDEGVGTWRLVLRESGPLPARRGGLQLATGIHSTSRNLSCFDSAQFSRRRPLRESVPRRRTPPPP